MGEQSKLQYIPILIVLVSFLLHLSLFLGISHIEPNWKSPPPETVEVDFIAAPEAPNRHVVDIDPNQQKLNELKSKVQKLSEFATRVKKETLAEKSGALTRNLQEKSNSGKKNLKNKISNRTKKLFEMTDSDIRVSSQFDPSAEPTLMLPSMTSNYIPNVERADATALNADQFKYFSYYSRLKNKLYPKWSGQIQKIATHSSSSQLYRLAKKRRYTQLKAVLNKDGYIQKISLIKSAGIAALDQIAINAFRESSPILNPPAGMVRDDGLIYIHYGFNVEFNPRHIVRKNR